MRNTIGYDTDHTVPEGDTASYASRLKIESFTRLDLTKYDVICGFSAPQQYTLDSLVTALNDPNAVVLSPEPFESMK